MASPLRILIINPNSTTSMTDSLRAPIESLAYNNVRPFSLPFSPLPLLPSPRPLTPSHQTTHTYHTAPPSSPPSINDWPTIHASTTATLPTLIPLLPTHDAFLIACYSPHPLVPALQALTSKPVIGIFEASVSTALNLLAPEQRFGIVSTGKIWESILGDAIRGEVLGEEKAGRVFTGVETLGLDAGDLHGDAGEEVVKRKVMAAAGRLLGGGSSGGEVKVIVLGCAGMAGMEEWVREEVKRRGKEVKVVDGVKAGVGILQGICRGQF